MPATARMVGEESARQSLAGGNGSAVTDPREESPGSTGQDAR